MSELACVSESVYRDALTRGKLYTVLATDGEKRQVRILGDNERIRWFPAYCFDQGDRTVPVLTRYWIEDPITSDYDLPIEVTVLLSNNEKRWCIFTTPSGLANCGDRVEGTEVCFHYGNRHIIIAGELSKELIGRMLHHIDRQGQLVECTFPLVHCDDEKTTEANAM